MSKKRIALVTGASRGIGAATAIEFARRGYSVTITARSADALDDVAGKIRQAGGEPIIRPGDLADFEGFQTLSALFFENVQESAQMSFKTARSAKVSIDSCNFWFWEELCQNVTHAEPWINNLPGLLSQ